jgi:hypothetical protein
MIFTEGLEVTYDEYLGIIKFVGNSYVTLCIKTFPEDRARDVCMIIHRCEYHKIKLLKESDK